MESKNKIINIRVTEKDYKESKKVGHSNALRFGIRVKRVFQLLKGRGDSQTKKLIKEMEEILDGEK